MKRTTAVPGLNDGSCTILQLAIVHFRSNMVQMLLYSLQDVRQSPLRFAARDDLTNITLNVNPFSAGVDIRL